MSSSRVCFLGSVALLLVGCGSEVAEPDLNASTWVRRFGRSSYIEQVALSAFAQGGVVVAGRFYGEVDFGGGKLPSPNNNYQAFVAKYDTQGKHVYSRSFGGDFAEAATRVAALSDGSVVLTGYYNWPVDFGTGELLAKGFDDVFVVKLDPTGKVVWAKSLGGAGQQRSTAIAAMPDGGVVLAGATNGAFDVDLGETPGSSTGFLLRLDAKGEPLWARPIVGNPSVHIADIAVSADEHIVLGGSFDDRLKIEGMPDLVAENYNDGFLATYDSSGKALWSRKVGGMGYADTVLGVAMGADGSTIFATGQVQGTVDFGGGPMPGSNDFEPNCFLLALSSSGQHISSKRSGGSGGNVAHGIAVDSTGRMIMTGEFYQSISFGAGDLVSNGSSDAWVVTYDPDFKPEFQAVWGDGEQQAGYRVAVDGTDRVYVAGGVLGSVDFGLGPTVGSGYFESFLVALPR